MSRDCRFKVAGNVLDELHPARCIDNAQCGDRWEKPSIHHAGVADSITLRVLGSWYLHRPWSDVKSMDGMRGK